MRHDSAYCLDGIMDCVCVYERDLSAEEISELYEAGLDGRAVISTWPKTLEFYADEGGSNPASQTISISNIGVGILNYQITEDCPWLEVNPNSGSCSAGETDEVAVSVDISGLIGGWYDCNLAVSDPNALNSPQTAEVILGIMLAGELHVPSEYPTIQAAIDLATDGSTVIVEPNVYTGAGNRDIDFRGKAITVRSIDPTDPNIVAATIIDCDANTSDRHRGFIFQSGEDSNSVLAGFTIINGYNLVGGGIYCNGSSPTITDCVITGNSGAGIACEEAYPTISNCIISYNSGFGHGGGIHCSCEGFLRDAVIDNCTFIGNSAGHDGGAIEGWGCVGTITNCTFMWNTAGDDGGALGYCYGVISNCVFIANSAGVDGGALYKCAAEISNCLLSCNWAAGNGGGSWAWPYDDVWPSFTNCTITGNLAGGYGWDR
jgi:predicted outer membrane repeat protein/parallel beta-helix repeat protein